MKIAINIPAHIVNQTRVTSSFYRNHFNDTGSTALTTYLSKNGILYCWSLPTFITDQLNIFVTFISTRLFPWLVYSLLCLFVCLLSFLGGRGAELLYTHSQWWETFVNYAVYCILNVNIETEGKPEESWRGQLIFFFFEIHFFFN